jgi:RNA polymerase primary sigma factor
MKRGAAPVVVPQDSGRDAVRRGKLLRAARRGDRGARERLVVAHLDLVRAVASRYRDLGVPLDDLVQEGTLGLLDAIDHYDPGRGPAFESYARFRVRRAIRNALTEQARLIRLPKQVVERRRAIERAEAGLAAAGGRRPTPAQLAAATGLPVQAVVESRGLGVPPVSLDGALPDGSSLQNVVADPAAADPADEALARERHELLEAALAQLPDRERRVVMARWGLSGSPRAAAELAAELELSPRRAQTIVADALHHLRLTLEAAETKR